MKPNTIQDVLLRLVICEPSVLETGCWEWPGARNSKGYGNVRLGGKSRPVHCVVYEHFVGAIPDDMEIDHLCRIHHCANFEHLEAVPHKVNVLRGEGVAAQHARKTHCVNGHELTPENCYRTARSWRACRQCGKERYARLHQEGPGPHALKTHCPHGHEYTPENTRIYRNGRFCLACQYFVNKGNRMMKNLGLEPR